MTLIDLSHEITDGMSTYPGLPGPLVGSHLSFEESAAHYAEGVEFSIGRVEMVTNTGTYLDTPAHRWRDGHDLAGLALERCADLPAVVLDGDVFDAAALLALGDVRGCAVLLRSGWDRHWGSQEYADPVHPHVTQDAAHALVEAGVVLVGIDSVNIDSTVGGERPAHSVLLRAGVPVVEHLTGLDALPVRGARFTAVPPRFAGLATFPVRAFAVVPG